MDNKFDGILFPKAWQIEISKNFKDWSSSVGNEKGSCNIYYVFIVGGWERKIKEHKKEPKIWKGTSKELMLLFSFSQEEFMPREFYTQDQEDFISSRWVSNPFGLIKIWKRQNCIVDLDKLLF